MLSLPRLGSLVLGMVMVALGAGCGDLFHGTEWSTLCDEHPHAKGCASGSASGTNGAGGSSSSSAVGGSGGSGKPDGTGPNNASLSCKKLLDDGFGTGNGNYWIDPAGGGPTSAFEAFCDMDDGGWTLAAVVSGADASSWTSSATWSDADVFGTPSSNDFDVDMKNRAFSTLAVTQVRLENASAGIKTSTAISYPSLTDLFGSTSLVTLQGSDSAWVYDPATDMPFFAQVENPPKTAGVNLSQRNGCILAVGYDSFNPGTGPDDEVEGFGCSAGSGGGSGACFAMSCADVVRDASLRIFIR